MHSTKGFPGAQGPAGPAGPTVVIGTAIENSYEYRGGPARHAPAAVSERVPEHAGVPAVPLRARTAVLPIPSGARSPAQQLNDPPVLETLAELGLGFCNISLPFEAATC